MKLLRILGLLLTLTICSTSVQAQNEQDFASRYMSLYAKGTSLKCTTVSPLMLEKMMDLPDVKSDEQKKALLSQLKSIRLVNNTAKGETQKLYNNAQQLAKHNAARYKLYAQRQSKRLYVRRKDGLIVEMVLFMKHNSMLRLINLTGNMTDEFIKQVMGL